MTKIIGACLGLSLATGVGVGIAAGQQSIEESKAAAGDIVSWSRTGTTNNLTSGFTMVIAASAQDGYYQDGSGEVRYVGAKSTTPLWTIAPTNIYLTAVIGGGTAKSLANPVEASLLDASGNVISSTTTTITNVVTTTTGDEYSIALPSVETAYGIRISHTKESGYNVRYYSFVLSTVAPTTVTYTDVITRDTTGATSTTYINWSNKTLESTAVYAGNSAGGNSSVQLRTSGSTSGVITTASGGNLKSVKLTFNSETAVGRKVDVYGKDAAYEAASDLYSSSTRGTKLGDATYASGTLSYVISVSGTYHNVGIRSNDGALYLTSIEITWETTSSQASVTALAVTTNPTKTTYGVGETLELAGLVVTATYSDSTSSTTNNYTTSISEGYEFQQADINNAYQVTVTSRENAQITTSFNLTIVSAFPKYLNRIAYANYLAGMKLNEGIASFTAVYTDNSSVADIKIGNAKTVLKNTSGTVIDPSTAVADDYDGQQLIIYYTDQNHTVENKFYVNVVEPLSINSIYNRPDYILINTTTSSDPKISVAYTSYNAELTSVSVVSNSSNLTVHFNSSDVTYNVNRNGSIPFTLTAGSAAGQYSVTITITQGENSVSRAYNFIVRSEAPGHDTEDGTYTKVTNLSDVTTGKYVIASNVGGTYYSVKAYDNKKYTSEQITVSNNKVTSTSFTVFDITKDGNNYSIKNGSAYMAYDKSTDLKTQTTAYNWSIASGTNGTFSIIPSGADTRGLVFRTIEKDTEYYCFKAYTLTNLTSLPTQYYDIELFKYSGSESSFDLVKAFVDSYMHMDDISITNAEDTGACLGNSGYYLTAKVAFHNMVESYTGSDNLQTVFSSLFTDAYNRYVAWANRNGDTQPFVGTTIVANQQNSLLVNITNNENTAIAAIVVVLTLIMGSAAAFFILKKKKHN